MNNISKVVFVEREEEKDFFISLLRNMGLDGYSVRAIKNISNLDLALQDLTRSPGYELIKSIVLIFDSSLNIDGRFSFIKSALKNNELPIPNELAKYKSKNTLNVGVFLIQCEGNAGMLESLLLETIRYKEVMLSVNSHLDSIDELAKNSPEEVTAPANKDIAALYSYLSVMEEFTICLKTAAEKNYFDFSSHSLDDLKKFISTN